MCKIFKLLPKILTQLPPSCCSRTKQNPEQKSVFIRVILEFLQLLLNLDHIITVQLLTSHRLLKTLCLVHRACFLFAKKEKKREAVLSQMKLTRRLITRHKTACVSPSFSSLFLVLCADSTVTDAPLALRLMSLVRGL